MGLRQSRGWPGALLVLSLLGGQGCGRARVATEPLPEEGGGAPGGEPLAPVPQAPWVDLRADVNRNGVVDLEDPSEDEAEERWDAQHGAIFLANLDDDEKACPLTDARGNALSDVELAKCSDAADAKVNGPKDLEDLAPLFARAGATLPEGALGQLSATPLAGASRLRVFKQAGDAWVAVALGTEVMTAEELKQGVALRLESRDIARDASVWDGQVDLTLSVFAPGQAKPLTDTVRLRVSPVLTFHQALPAESVYVSQLPGEPSSVAFRSALADAVGNASGATSLVALATDDQWTQDFFETGYMAMPRPGGQQQVMRVNFRSANIYFPKNHSSPLRKAGRVVFTQLRGPDVAGIQQYDLAAPADSQSLNSFGNTETIPPYSKDGQDYPFGRVLRGSTQSFYPDPSFSRMLQAQRLQPEVNVDTSWLLVGHVDETLSFLPANTPRGWVVLANDARLARQLLEGAKAQGHGSALVFEGQRWMDDYGMEYSAQTTINQVLDDVDVMAASARGAAEVDAQLSVLRAELGLSDEEIVRVPFLHQEVDGSSLAYQPGTVNGLLLDAHHFVAPDPHGPKVDGKDLFQEQLRNALAPYGVSVHFVDDWDLYHRLAGEVHCGTNATRAIPAARWWESGR